MTAPTSQLPDEQGPAPSSQSTAQPIEDGTTDLTRAQLAELQDEEKQAEYRRQYLRQVELRRGCEGCGN